MWYQTAPTTRILAGMAALVLVLLAGAWTLSGWIAAADQPQERQVAELPPLPAAAVPAVENTPATNRPASAAPVPAAEKQPAPVPSAVSAPEQAAPPAPAPSVGTPAPKAAESASVVNNAPLTVEPVVPAVAAKIKPIVLPVDRSMPDEPPAERTTVKMEPEPVLPTAVVVQHRRDRSAEDLRIELSHAPELALDAVPGSSAKVYQVMRQIAGRGKPRPEQHPLTLLTRKRPDLIGLPLVMGDHCQLGKEPAENLHALSRKLRTFLSKSTAAQGRGGNTGDTRIDPDLLRQTLLAEDEKAHWLQTEAIPTMQQMLMAERKSVRLLLVEFLSRIDRREATVALAQRAIYDLNVEVREAAIKALRDRPREEYQKILVDGLIYPWAPVADHSSRALIALDLKEAVPQMIAQLDLGDPRLITTISNGKPVVMIRELVRVNHFKNCLLCHAPSFQTTDLVRGTIPDPTQPLPATSTLEYYSNITRPAVRADVTYLRQDFSVFQPVEKPGVWPIFQRFDYLVRLRPLRPTDPAAKPGSSEQYQATLFTLQKLTGKNPGPAPEDWKRLLIQMQAASRGVQASFLPLNQRAGAGRGHFSCSACRPLRGLTPFTAAAALITFSPAEQAYSVSRSGPRPYLGFQWAMRDWL